MGGTLGKVIYTFFNNKWNVDFVLNHYLAKPALRFGHDVTYKVIDRGLIEQLGPVGISNGLVNLTGWISKIQSGQIYNYAFSIFLATTLILLGNNLSLDLDLAILLPMLYYISTKSSNSSKV